MAEPIRRDLAASDDAYRLLVEAVEDYAIFMLDPEDDPHGIRFVVTLKKAR